MKLIQNSYTLEIFSGAVSLLRETYATNSRAVQSISYWQTRFKSEIYEASPDDFYTQFSGQNLRYSRYRCRTSVQFLFVFFPVQPEPQRWKKLPQSDKKLLFLTIYYYKLEVIIKNGR